MLCRICSALVSYMSPEVLSGKAYSEKCDVWSLGVVCFIMLSGLPPFVTPGDLDGRGAQQPFWIYMQNLRAGSSARPVEFRDDMGFKYVSAQAKHFLASVLELDPAKRMRSGDALQHPWLKRRRPTHQPASGGGSGSASTDHTKQNIHQQHHQLNHFLTLTLSRKFDLAKLKEELGSDDALSPNEAASAEPPAAAEPTFHPDHQETTVGAAEEPMNYSYSQQDHAAAFTDGAESPDPPRSFSSVSSSSSSDQHHRRDSSLASTASSSSSFLARKARVHHYATLPVQYTAEEEAAEEDELEPEFHESEDEHHQETTAPPTVG